MMEDARKLEERNWRNAARNRDSWQNLLKKASVQKVAVVPMMRMMVDNFLRRVAKLEVPKNEAEGTVLL